MRLSNWLHFLTLVLATLLSLNSFRGENFAFLLETARSAPSTDIPPDPIVLDPSQKQGASQVNPELQYTLTPSEVPKDERARPLRLSDLPTYVTHANFGFLQGTILPNKQLTVGGYVGAGETHYYPNFTSSEWGVQFTYDNIFIPYLNYRSYCCEGAYYGAYYKAGLGAAYEASDGIANLVNYQRYHLSVGVGLDDVARKHNRYGFEASFIMAFNGLAFATQGFIAF